MSRMIVGAILACDLALACTAAQAATPPPGAASIEVSGAWSRPAPAGMAMGVVYLTVQNRGDAPDRLVGATTPVAARASLHRSELRAGVMTMTAAPDGLPVPAHGSAHLAPGGYHLMLSGLNGALIAGRRFPLTLRFAHAGARKVQVQVRPAAPDPMPAMAMPGMKP